MLKKTYKYADVLLIVAMAMFPLFVTFPYRVNIFLSWEGAYRISEGQVPFRDFGTPLGGMFWVVPALFFKIFGPYLVTLVKSQVFINIMSGLAFRSILRSIGVNTGLRFLSVFLFCISYSFFNFWPWYNHTVIVYEFVGLAFILAYILRGDPGGRMGWLAGGGAFILFSFLTKQDGGGMAFVIGIVLLLYHTLTSGDRKGLLLYVVFFLLFFVLAGSIYGWRSFGYWFNHGQPPHTSRISVFDLMEEFLGRSEWIKFYLFMIILVVLPRMKDLKALWKDRSEMIFLILTVFILGEAAVFQVTSYTPPDNNIFFHSFAVSFILYRIGKMGQLDFGRAGVLIASLAGLLLLWSGTYWKYLARIAAKTISATEVNTNDTNENVVDRHTYMIRTDSVNTGEPEYMWTYCGLKAFDRVYMPSSTANGIQRLMGLDLIKSGRPLKVLNMSELTPLAVEIPYELERNPEYPLWYHLGVGMFNKQAEMFERRIGERFYDLVLFEYIPSLNNFYPFRVRDSLKQHYRQIDSFAAPRRGDTQGVIEIYVPL